MTPSNKIRIDARYCKGVNTFNDSSEIHDNEIQTGNNIVVDTLGKIKKRLGANKVLNDPGGRPVVALGYFNAPNVDERMVQVQDTAIYDSTLPLATSGSWTDRTGSNTITADQYATDMTVCDDKLFITNGKDYVHYHNGAGIIEEGDENTDPPFCKIGCYHKNRYWLFNETGRATVTGDVTTYTASAGDKLKIIIDGATTFDDIDLEGDETIADAVTSINAVDGFSAKGLAWKDSSGYLRISSLTTGMGSSVTVADGGAGNGGECEDLFDGSTASATGNENPEWGYYSNALAPATFNRSTQVFKAESGDATEITAAVPLGDSIYIFKESSIHELIVQGATATYWNLRPVERSRGCISYYCAKPYKGVIYYFYRDGIGGLGGEDIPIGVKSTWDTINWDYVNRSRMVIWDDKLLLSVPTSQNYPDTVLVYDFLTKAWSVWSGIYVNCWGVFVEKTAGSAGAEEENLMYGHSNDGWIYQLGKSTQYNDDSSAIDLDIVTKDYDAGRPDTYKHGGWFYLRIITGPDTADTAITVYASIDGGSYSTLGTTKTTTKFSLFHLGRFKKIKFRIRHNATASTQIVLNGYSAELYISDATE